jgi:hypothetical protein
MSYFNDVLSVTSASSLRLFWMLDDFGPSVSDASTQGHTASLFGTEGTGYVTRRPSIVTAPSAGCLELNPPHVSSSSGTGYVLSDALSTNTLGDWCISFWHEHVYDIGSADQVIFHYSTSGQNNELVIGIDEDGDYYCVYKNAARLTFSDPPIQNSAYGIDRRFVSVRRNNASQLIALIINGIVIQSLSNTGGSITSGGRLSLGQGQDSVGVVTAPTDPFQGRLQSVIWWSTAVNTTDLVNLYTSGRGEYLQYYEPTPTSTGSTVVYPPNMEPF